MSQVVATYSDTAELVGAAGDQLISAIHAAVEARDQAFIVLTGGGTGVKVLKHIGEHGSKIAVSYTHLTLPTKSDECRSRWSPYQ